MKFIFHQPEFSIMNSYATSHPKKFFIIKNNWRSMCADYNKLNKLHLYLEIL